MSSLCLFLGQIRCINQIANLIYRLITLYQSLHDAIHGKSGQKEILKLQYIRTEHESVMGWVSLTNAAMWLRIINSFFM